MMRETALQVALRNARRAKERYMEQRLKLDAARSLAPEPKYQSKKRTTVKPFSCQQPSCSSQSDSYEQCDQPHR